MARTLARSGTGPIYEQIRRAIAEPIVAGRWRPGRRIPSEMELTKAFKASRMTVNRALTALAADGLIVRWRRRGSFVAERAVELSVFEIWDIAAEIERSGRAYAYELLAREPWSPTPTWQRTWTLPPARPCWPSPAATAPTARSCSSSTGFINLAAVPQADMKPSKPSRPAAGCWITCPGRKPSTPSAPKPPMPAPPGLMRIERGAACLVIERRTWQGRKTITLARLVHPGARHALTGRFRPAGAAAR